MPRQPAPRPPDPNEPPRGLVCRNCGCQHFRTIDTRPVPVGKIRRVRLCRFCGRRLVTREIPTEE